MMKERVRALVGVDPAPLLTLVAASAGSIALVASRFLYSGTRGYFFLIWNLILAWIPFLLALLLRMRVKKGARPGVVVFLLGALWVLFYPNAPYILTDFVHLRPRGDVPLWFDLVLIASFAWTGLLLGFASLAIVHRQVERLYGWARGWAFVVVVSILASFGIYLGRFARWNSWDVLTNPTQLLADIWSRIADPISHPRTVGVTVALTLFLLVVYLGVSAVAKLRGLRAEPE